MADGPTNLSSKPGAQPGDDTPHVGSLRWGPALTGTLYLLLVGSAALALWVRQFPGAAPRALEVGSPWVFLAFAVLFAVYRLVMAQAKKYPAGKAFFQIGCAALFFMLLLPHAMAPSAEAPDPVQRMLADSDPDARLIAAEVARYRPDGQRYGAALVKALRDSDGRVRAEAHRSLVQLYGADLGPPENPDAMRRWEEKVP